jgi:short-subunit dehydrogenase
MQLKDCVALVTGAASGIGRAVAVALGQEGARLALLDRSPEGLQTLADELTARGVSCAFAVADVRQRQEVQTAVRQLSDQLGPVDLLVASAGITGVTLVDDLDVETTESIIAVNLLGVIYTIDAVLPGMLARGSGHIVGISSLAGVRGLPFAAAYCASKAGLSAYLESLRPALWPRGIFVTTVLPGFVQTPLMKGAAAQPPMAMMAPEKAARHILAAILRRRRVAAFPWTTGLMLCYLRWLPPALFDWTMRRVARHIPNLKY